MDFNVARFLKSHLLSQRPPEEVAIHLMCMFRSWHQVPAGSLPSDDLELAILLDFIPRRRFLPPEALKPGEAQDRILVEWRKFKDGALAEWTLHSDGRYYHPEVVEVAIARYERYLGRKQAAEATNRKRKAKKDAK